MVIRGLLVSKVANEETSLWFLNSPVAKTWSGNELESPSRKIVGGIISSFVVVLLNFEGDGPPLQSIS